MYDTKYDKIPKEVLINLVLDMGRVIRALDPAGEWCEVYWTNDGNETGPAYNHALENAAKEYIAKYKKVSLVVMSYVCPDTPEGIERVKDALVQDFDASVRGNWDPYKMIVVEDHSSENAKTKVPPWLWEDLAELEEQRQ